MFAIIEPALRRYRRKVFHRTDGRSTLFAGICAFAVLAWPQASRAAFTIQFDYTYDTSGFFSGANLGRRALLDDAASVFENDLTTGNLGAITPGGGNTWSLSFPNPSTGVNVTLNNPVVAPNAITIYVGARDLPGVLIGSSSYQYSFFGNSSWVNLFQTRDSQTSFGSFGGAIAFDSITPWYFDTDPLTLESFPGDYDFYSVAEHEIGHLLGFTDGANAFNAHVSGTQFVGSHVEALFGGPAPLAGASDLDHWQQGLVSGGQEVLMDPTFFFNQRKTPTPLDLAAFQDIGYTLITVPEPTTASLVALAVVAFVVMSRRRVH